MFPAATGAVISQCCLLSKACMDFSFHFFLSISWLCFWAVYSLEWQQNTVAMYPLSRSWWPWVHFCVESSVESSLNTSFMLNWTLYNGFPLKKHTETYVFTHYSKDWGPTQGLGPWWPLPGATVAEREYKGLCSRMACMWVVADAWCLSWRTLSVSYSISWTLTVQVRLSLLQ